MGIAALVLQDQRSQFEFDKALMGDRGRKSSDALAIIDRPLDVIERVRPPHDLNDEETEVWASVVNTEPADWFSASTVPMLAQYCRHVVESRRLAELLERRRGAADFTIDEYEKLLKMQERETRAIAMLATRMRLSQQSTTNHRGHSNKKTSLKKLWG